MSFLKEFIKHPFEMGAFAETSPRMSRVMAEAAELAKRSTVVELGPGKGVITEAIVPRLAPDATFLTIEVNKNLTEYMNRHYPDVQTYHGVAQDLPKFLKESGKKNCDAIISGIPWAVMPVKEQEALMKTLYDTLEPGGVFVAIAYLSGLHAPSGRTFRKLMKRHFKDVGTTRVVWTNLPPALAYVCHK